MKRFTLRMRCILTIGPDPPSAGSGAARPLRSKPPRARGRVDIHGALNLEPFDAPFVEPVTVDGKSAVQLLAKIEVRNPDERTIHVIWDNAAYHRDRMSGPSSQGPGAASVSS